MNSTGHFIIHYDYGTGSTYLCVIADSAEQVVAELNHVQVVDAQAEGLTAEHIRRLKAIARPISDPFWDEMRKL